MVDQPSNNKYEQGLGKNAANFTSLTPLSFIERTARVFPDRTAVVHGETQRSWTETYQRCIKLASALNRRGINKGDTVAMMLPNVPASLEAHFGVPMCGAVLNALNIRLDAKTIAFILDHGEAEVLLTDKEFAPVINEALSLCEAKPLVIDVDDALAPEGELLGEIEYEAFLAEGNASYDWQYPENEWDAISLNYTSGTTGNPKGVVYHHRGAALNSLGNITAWAMPQRPKYLWTLPMFHCNGWCFPWTVTALAGTHICLRRTEPGPIYQSIIDHQVTHMCGAPIVMGMLVNASSQEQKTLPHSVKILTAGAAPPSAILEQIETLGFDVTHAYGLTECYGPGVVSEWHPEWDELPTAEKAAKKARQGVPYLVMQDLTVMDPETMQKTPADAQTMGEVFMRGNNLMKGYLKNETATEKAFLGGWFHTGDLGVMHPDGYIELKDRSKDIIISGGENISTIEVEGVLYQHPAVAEAAVVAKPDEKWGETPCAFVALKEEAESSEEELIQFCRDNLAHFKCPKKIVFTELPKTATGKIQKFILREQAKTL
ncbi:MAG TPA: acyl-CoA synthetase [Gammaproteobacteria bacterium]|jgi:fatty-acyl-CoA synthase|nr:acyl-CoA synthetase [Gammaproteobacteria bacterium]HIK96843.1 acyl-CoA synthetase [Gammaproteobacteria bacterium]